jgi:TatD DNase family protein
LGLHPLLVEKHTLVELNKFENLIARTSYIGEIGLDFSAEGYSTKKSQVDSLSFVLSIINDKPRFISLHSRKAEDEVLDLINKYKIVNAVFHWYSGSISTLEKILETGHYLSINPAMLKTKKGQKIIERLPQNRVLTETDGPHVQVGAGSVKPVNVKNVLGYLARVWSVSETEAEQKVFNNFEQLIKPISKSIS